MKYSQLIAELESLVSQATAGHRGDIRRMIHSLSLSSASSRTEERALNLIERVPIRAREKQTGWQYDSYTSPAPRRRYRDPW